MPRHGRHLLEWFYELDSTRTSNESGPDPLQPVQIEAWARMKRIALTPRQFDALLEFDTVFRTAIYGELKYSNERRIQQMKRDARKPKAK